MENNIVVVVLSVTIGLFFILVGSLKLSPIFNDDVYKEMRKSFIRFAKVFPFSELTGWKPSAHIYRRVVGVTEIICGLLLTFVPGQLKQIANITLLLLLSGAVYTHYIMGDTLDKMTSALIFSLLLLCRYIVRLQVNARESPLTNTKVTCQNQEIFLTPEHRISSAKSFKKSD